MKLKLIDDPILLIQTALDGRRAKNPQYSLRAFSKYLEIDPSTLSKVLSGQRSYPKNHLPKLIEKLNLSRDTELALTKNILNNEFQKKKNSLPQKSNQIEWETIAEDFSEEVIRDWEFFAILNLCNLDHFQSEVEWISQRLGLSSERVCYVINKLFEVGMLTETPSGNWLRTNSNYCTTNELSSTTLIQAHLQELNNASRSLVDDPIEKRGFYSVVVATNKTQINKFKKKAEQFLDKAMLDLEVGPKEDVYQLQLHFVPLTRD